MVAYRSSSAAVGTFALAAVVACSDSAGSGRGTLDLSVSTRSTVTAGSVAGASSLAPNTLVITRAQVVLSEIELEGSATAQCTASREVDDECEEVRLDPMLVDLPIDGVKPLDVEALVPAGTYRKLQLKIDAIESAESVRAAAFLAANPGFAGIALRVEGTFNGQPFVFTTRQDFHFEIELEQPITIGPNPPNLTISIDLASWFRNGAGDNVDPSLGANRSLIENNVQRSLRAFEDDDRDGRSDRE